MSLLLLVSLQPAAIACEPSLVDTAFDSRIDGATGIPTDARLGLRTDAHASTIEVLVTDPLGVAVPGAWSPPEHEVATGGPWGFWTPDAPLLPGTTYVAQAIELSAVQATASFTTGEAPSAEPFGTYLAGVTLGGWEVVDPDLGGCVPAEETREVDVELYTEGLPPLAFVEVVDRAAATLGDLPLAHLFEPVDAAGPETLSLSGAQWSVDRAPFGADYDCLTATVVLANGDRWDAGEVCGLGQETGCAGRRAAGPAVDGCSATGSGPVGLPTIGLAWLLRRRRPRR